MAFFYWFIPLDPCERLLCSFNVCAARKCRLNHDIIEIYFCVVTTSFWGNVTAAPNRNCRLMKLSSSTSWHIAMSQAPEDCLIWHKTSSRKILQSFKVWDLSIKFSQSFWSLTDISAALEQLWNTGERYCTTCGELSSLPFYRFLCRKGRNMVPEKQWWHCSLTHLGFDFEHIGAL